ncbi:MAG: TatD family hydrolase [Ferruginibacter sp.]
MIDTHTHLYSTELAHDIDAVIGRAISAGVDRFYLPAIDSETHGPMIALEERYPGVCLSMIGLHPCSVKENYLEEIAVIKEHLAQRKFAGIGETGLDFYWDTSFKAEQYKALELQVTLALEHKLPLILHTRNAMQETIDFITNYKGTGLKGIFHCFGGTVQEAEQIIECGFLLGIGGVLTYKKAGLDLVLAETGMEHIVLETDAPYLSPVPYRGKRNESAYLVEVAKKLAEVKKISLEEVDRITTENAENLFGK